MFRDAQIAEVIEHTPCVLTKVPLGPLVDSNPEWRDGAVFTREEAEDLILPRCCTSLLAQGRGTAHGRLRGQEVARG
jgi:hypothetical protein